MALNVAWDFRVGLKMDRLEITTPAAARAFAHPGQRKLLLALIPRERSLSELSGLTGAPLNLLHHHIRKFLRLGLVEITRRQRRPGAAIKFYRATAREFFVPADLAPSAPTDLKMAALTAALQRDRLRAAKGVLYSHDGSAPRMRRIADPDYAPTAVELWRELRLSDADAAAFAGELRALITRFEARSGEGGRRRVFHAALAVT